MLILMYVILSGIKMWSLNDFGAPRILLTTETWEIILAAAHIARQLLPASVVSVLIVVAKEGACGVRGSEAKVCVSNPNRNQKTLNSVIFSRSSNLF